jgi:hypothetical protein
MNKAYQRARSRPISRVLSIQHRDMSFPSVNGAAIHLGWTSPPTSSDLPGSACGPHVPLQKKQRVPLFGLAPGGVYPATGVDRRGALLPHLFTLTTPAGAEVRRYVFCGTFRELTPPRCYLAPCPVEPGLSSALRVEAAAARSTPHLFSVKPQEKSFKSLRGYF